MFLQVHVLIQGESRGGARERVIRSDNQYRETLSASARRSPPTSGGGGGERSFIDERRRPSATAQHRRKRRNGQRRGLLTTIGGGGGGGEPETGQRGRWRVQSSRFRRFVTGLSLFSSGWQSPVGQFSGKVVAQNAARAAVVIWQPRMLLHKTSLHTEGIEELLGTVLCPISS